MALLRLGGRGPGPRAADLDVALSHTDYKGLSPRSDMHPTGFSGLFPSSSALLLYRYLKSEALVFEKGKSSFSKCPAAACATLASTHRRGSAAPGLAPCPGLPAPSVPTRGRCPVTQVGPWGEGLSVSRVWPQRGWAKWTGNGGMFLWPPVRGLGAESHGAEAVCLPQPRETTRSRCRCDSVNLTGTKPSPRALRQAWSEKPT